MERKKFYETHEWFLWAIGALLCIGGVSYCYDGSVLSRLGDVGAILTALALWFVRGEIREQIERENEQIEREKKGRGVDGLSKFLTTIEGIDSQYRIPVTQKFSSEEAGAILKGESLKINDEEKREAFSHLLGNNGTLEKNNVLRLRSAIGDVLNRLNWMGMIEKEYGGIDIMKQDMTDFLSPKPEIPTAEICQKIRDEYTKEEYEKYFGEDGTNNAGADKEIDLYVMKRTTFFNIREAVREASERDRYPGITAFIKRHIKDINEEWREKIKAEMKNHPQQQGKKSANTPT